MKLNFSSQFTAIVIPTSLVKFSEPNVDWRKFPAAKHLAHRVSMSIEISFNWRWFCECCVIAIESIEWRRSYITEKWHISEGFNFEFQLLLKKMWHLHRDSFEWWKMDYWNCCWLVHVCRSHLQCPSLTAEYSLDFRWTNRVFVNSIFTKRES